MATTWDPWKALSERPHLIYGRMDIAAAAGGGLYWPVGKYVAVLIDPAADRVRTRCLLAHELIHDERDGGCCADYMPPTWDAVVMRIEGWIDDEVADRLVPPEDVWAFCERVSGLGMGVTPADVAAEFDVTEEVAERALSRLAVQLRQRGGPRCRSPVAAHDTS